MLLTRLACEYPGRRRTVGVGESRGEKSDADRGIGRRVLKIIASRVRGIILRDTMLLFSWIWRAIILNVSIISPLVVE